MRMEYTPISVRVNNDSAGPVIHGSLVRMRAVARILMSKAQALAFLAGANSLFYGDRLLTTATNAVDEDVAMLAALGIAVPCWQPAWASRRRSIRPAGLTNPPRA